MSLQTKILNLKLNAALAVKHAQGWQRLIDLYGEQRATEFYSHLGLNHLEIKSVEWEGLQLSRQPKDHEKLMVKGVAQAQESSREAISSILLALRTELIADGLEGIKQLDPATYHELILDAPAEFRSSLRDRLIDIHRQGRMLVAAELNMKAAVLDDGEFDDLDLLTDLTDSRIANDVQSRIIAAATRFSLLGLTGSELNTAVQNEITTGSVSYIDRAATGAANRTLAIGRMNEMRNHAAEIDWYEQSEILDSNTCGPCAGDDGKTASDPDDLPGAPNPECEGGDYCRGFIVAIVN